MCETGHQIGLSYPIFCWGRCENDDHPAEWDGDDSKDEKICHLDGEDDEDVQDIKENGAGSCADSDNDHDW